MSAVQFPVGDVRDPVRHARRQPVASEFAESSFYDGIDSDIRDGMTSVPPGGSITIHPDVIDSSISSDMPTGSDDAQTILWPIRDAGRYTVTVVYAPPRLDALSPAQCVGDSGAATVSFTIASAKASSMSHVWRLTAIIAGAVVLLVLLIALWWWLRRRGGRATAVAAAILLIAGVAVAGVNTGVHPAYARWISIGGGADFLNDIQDCFKEFEIGGTSGDPSNVMPTVLNGHELLQLRPQWPDQNSRTLWRPNASAGPGSVIHWNNKVSQIHTPNGSVVNACAELYHELVHFKQNSQGKFSSLYCDDSGIEVNEVEATLEENEYRATHNLGHRNSYGPHALPDSMADCTKNQTPSQNFKMCLGTHADERRRLRTTHRKARRRRRAIGVRDEQR